MAPPRASCCTAGWFKGAGAELSAGASEWREGGCANWGAELSAIERAELGAVVGASSGGEGGGDVGFEPYGWNGGSSMPCGCSDFRSSHTSDQRSTAWPISASRRSSAGSARRPRQRSACSARRRFSACRAPVGRGERSRRGAHWHAARRRSADHRAVVGARLPRTVLATLRLRTGCLRVVKLGRRVERHRACRAGRCRGRVVKLGRRRTHELFTALGCAMHRRLRRHHHAVDGRQEISRQEIRIRHRRCRRLGLRTRRPVEGHPLWEMVEGHPLWEMEQGQHPAGGHAADGRSRGTLKRSWVRGRRPLTNLDEP